MIEHGKQVIIVTPKSARFSTNINKFFHICLLLVVWLVGWAMCGYDRVLAQEPGIVEVPQDTTSTGADEVIAESPVTLPGSRQMALALATPALRREALLDLAVAANITGRVKLDQAADSAVFARQFLDDRGWLARLVERYGWAEPHSAILDPAAWLVQVELQQHDLPVKALEFPDRIPRNMLLAQTFLRSDERLAVATLPVLLLRLEADVLSIWDAFLQLAGAEGTPGPAWQPVETKWFADRLWPTPESFISDWPAYTGTTGSRDAGPALNTLDMLSQLISDAVETGPPEPLRLARLRFALLDQYPQLSARQQLEYRASLHTASLSDGLQDGRFFEFTRGVLSLLSELLEYSLKTSEVPPLTHWLLTELPSVIHRYGNEFAAVDPGLNTILATVQAVLQKIDTSGSSGMAIKSPRAALADAIAQMGLMIPDMGYYFDTPVRARIIEEINICTSIAANRDDEGFPAMTRGQFDNCMEGFLQLAGDETRTPELSGDTRGPFSNEALQRELSVTPVQRINYAVGFLHDRFATDCQPPAQALPNPLEWAVLANVMAWFADYKADFFMTPANESRLASMRGIGEQAARELSRQARCFTMSGAGGNDPVNRNLAIYETALRQLNAGMLDAEADFRQTSLRPGADVLLDQGASQSTAYRPEELLISPCSQEATCEMSANLSTTRALIGMFPEVYLLADQSRMGRIELCYQNMEWVQRRSELVRPDDENVANYYGRLGFDLVGRYFENNQYSNILGFRFVSPGEHHYLFAQTAPEVLQDGCPIEWVGTRVVTPLRENHGGIVPNRLTYLAASRTLPSRLLQANWDRGSEWRDWFVTGLGVTPLEFPAAPDISTRLNQHLQALHQAEKAEIYRRVLTPGVTDAEGENVSLFEEITQVSVAKAMLRMQMIVFYPDSLSVNDAVRSAITGDAGLLDISMLRRFKADNVAPARVKQIAESRLQQLQKNWLSQPEALRRNGSIPASLAYALTRINSLYRQLFTLKVEPPEDTGLLPDA